MTANDPLSLDEQVCFAITVAAREVVAAYRPVLAPLGLTHPQYLVMLALWESDAVSVGQLAARLSLEPATLTPLLKRLERDGHVERRRAQHDERLVLVHLTDAGRSLRERALEVPPRVLETFGLDVADLAEVNRILRDLAGRARPTEVLA
jgi:DNA-binding MarR family transcriptional regulator